MNPAVQDINPWLPWKMQNRYVVGGAVPKIARRGNDTEAVSVEAQDIADMMGNLEGVAGPVYGDESGHLVNQ